MKKKKSQKAAVFFISLSLLACSVAGGMTASAAEVRPADVTIKYDGSHKIQTSEDDFFGAAGKNLMPGSSFTREMDIVNDSEDDIVVYLKAEIGEDVYAEYVAKHPDAPESALTYAEQLIKEMPMSITALDRNGDPMEVYYKGPASGDPQHQDINAANPGLTARYPNTEHGIVIGRLSYGAIANLTFQVQVPTTLGNEYQDTISMVKWILVCDATPPEDIPDESIPLTPTVPTSPNGDPSSSSDEEEIPDVDPPYIDGPVTGDNRNPASMAVIMAVVSAVLVLCLLLLLVIKRQKDKDKKEQTVKTGNNQNPK